MFHYKNQNNGFNFNKLCSILVLSGLGLAQANAADWETIKTTKDYVISVDLDSYNQTEGLPFMTTKTVFKQPQSAVQANHPFSFIEAHTTRQFNCQLQTFRMLSTRYYQKKQVLINTQNRQTAFAPLMKGSDEAMIASLVCQVQQMVGGQ